MEENAATGPTAFSSDSEHWLRASAESTVTSKRHADWEDLYELDSCTEVIKKKGYQRVALQFPDHLLADAVAVATALRERTGARVFVLGDTTYGSCCVDAVAAEHLDADFIIHYGHACLTPVASVPVMYVFVRQPIDINDCCDRAAEVLAPSDPVLLFYAVEYAHCIGELVQLMQTRFEHVVASELNIPSVDQSGQTETQTDTAHTETDIQRDTHKEGTTAPKSCNDCTCSNRSSVGMETMTASMDACSLTGGCRCQHMTEHGCCGNAGCGQSENAATPARGCCGGNRERKTHSKAPTSTHQATDTQRETEKEEGETEREGGDKGAHTQARRVELPAGRDISEYTVVYLGQESLTLRNLMMVYNKCRFVTYDPVERCARVETLNVNRALMRRYFLVQKAKDASVVGLLVGTLGAAQYLPALDYLKKIVSEAGKKAYVIVIGKINENKLANYLGIDIFCLVACPENSLIDSKDFHADIITPFELEIACVRGKEWTGDFVTDFSRILPGLSEEASAQPEAYADGKEDSEDEPEFSFITGTYRQRVQPAPARDGANVTDVSVRNTATDIVLHSPAADFLSKSSYRGLEVRAGETEVRKAREGAMGIAKGYTHESAP